MHFLERNFCLDNQIPLLGLSTLERLQGLLAYRNDRRLFRRKCDQSQETLISAYHPDSDFRVIKSDLWWGDGWDGLESGVDPDFNISFFDQFSRLQKKIPREGTTVVNSENCSYNSHTRESRNCYLSHLAFKSEDLLHCFWSTLSKNLLDCSYSRESSFCYDCTYITNCYQCFRTEESSNCSDCCFSFQLSNCQNCLLCSNLSHKEFYYLNQPCSKPEYERLLAEVLSSREAYTAASAEFLKLKKHSVSRATHSLNSENVSGEHLINCKNCWNCFDLVNSQDCYNATNSGGRDLIHTYSAGFPECEEVYCSVTLRTCSRVFFSSNCWSSHDLWYCDNCVSCKDCFGSVGLKHKQYCFLNKQYTKSEYVDLVDRFRKKMIKDKSFGMFFPIRYSPFAYNESAAQDFFPLSRSSILELGYRWRDPQVILSTSERNSTAVKICRECASPYRITAPEQTFLKDFKLMEPEICPDCRIFKRIERRNPYSLVTRKCRNCDASVESAYDDLACPAVYCENCFKEEFLA